MRMKAAPSFLEENPGFYFFVWYFDGQKEPYLEEQHFPIEFFIRTMDTTQLDFNEEMFTMLNAIPDLPALLERSYSIILNMLFFKHKQNNKNLDALEDFLARILELIVREQNNDTKDRLAHFIESRVLAKTFKSDKAWKEKVEETILASYPKNAPIDQVFYYFNCFYDGIPEIREKATLQQKALGALTSVKRGAFEEKYLINLTKFFALKEYVATLSAAEVAQFFQKGKTYDFQFLLQMIEGYAKVDICVQIDNFIRKGKQQIKEELGASSLMSKFGGSFVGRMKEEVDYYNFISGVESFAREANHPIPLCFQMLIFCEKCKRQGNSGAGPAYGARSYRSESA